MLPCKEMQALVWHASFKPDAIMLDIQLPDMKGWTVLDRLKHHADHAAHSSSHHFGHDELQRGLKLGAFACLQKPVTEELLAGVVQYRRVCDAAR